MTAESPSVVLVIIKVPAHVNILIVSSCSSVVKVLTGVCFHRISHTGVLNVNMH